MPKRINLPVNKLIQQPPKTTKTNSERPTSTKPLTFQQLFQMARHHQPPHSQSAIDHQSLPLSHQTSQHQSEGVRTTGHTPQNSNRNRRNREFDKLNRSLQARGNSQEKAIKNMRSLSNEKSKKLQPQLKQRCQSTKIQKNNYVITKNLPQSPPRSKNPQFKDEFHALVKKLDHSSHSHLRQTECFLSIDETFHLLKQLHYLRKIEDEKYLVKLWQELQGDTYGGIPSQNLYEFLCFVNHYDPSNLYQNHPQENHKKILINSNLKIVADQKAKIDIYQQYLALRVNRILYGNGQADYQSSQKKLRRTSNIKIVDDSSFDSSEKKKQPTETKRLSFAKKTTSGSSQGQVVNPPKRAVKLRANSAIRPLKQEQPSMQKDKSEETICYSQISQTKQSGKVLTSNQSDFSLHTSQENEQPAQPQKKPILSIDVNLGEGQSEKLLVFEGETALEVSRRLVVKYNIDESLRVKFEAMLNGHIRNLLWRIEEVSEDLTSDRQE